MLKKRIRAFLSQIFHAKRVLIVTDKGVNYYPFGKLSQLGFFAAIIGFISWASYSTGSFMAAESLIEEKDRRIAEVNLENKQIENKFSLLKRDLVRLHSEEDKELSDYTKFVIDQYSGDSMVGIDKLARGEITAEGSDGMMMERLKFLEDRVEQLKQENHDIVEAVRYQTQDKIAEFQTIINKTGLNTHVLEQRKAELEDEQNESKGSATGDAKEDELPRGGPFIPASLANVAGIEEVFTSIDRMMELQEILGMLPLETPIESARVTSGFGQRLDPFSRRPASHTGVDLMGPIGSKILAANDGVVTFTGRERAYGNMVDVDHGLGVTTRYGHMSKILAKAGQKVSKGDVIGIEGSTGRSTGQHLHYEVRYNDSPMDPMRFIRVGKKLTSD